jgi:hypothetical protein
MPFSSLRRPLRRLRLRIERARLARRIGELRDLVDVPHDLAEVARAKVNRLVRRDRALGRLIG